MLPPWEMPKIRKRQAFSWQAGGITSNFAASRPPFGAAFVPGPGPDSVNLERGVSDIHHRFTMGSVEFLPPLVACHVHLVEDVRTDPPSPPAPKGKTDGFSVKLPSTLDTPPLRAWPLPGRHPRTSTVDLDDCFVCLLPSPIPHPRNARTRPAPAVLEFHQQQQQQANHLPHVGGRLSKPNPTQRLHGVGLNHPPSQPAARGRGGGGGLYPPSDGSQTAVRGRHRGRKPSGNAVFNEPQTNKGGED